MRIRLLDDDNKRDNLGVVKRTVWGLARDEEEETHDATDVDEVDDEDENNLNVDF